MSPQPLSVLGLQRGIACGLGYQPFEGEVAGQKVSPQGDAFLGLIKGGLVSRKIPTSELSPQSCLALPGVLFKTRRPSGERPEGTDVKLGLFCDEWQTWVSKFMSPGGGRMGLMLTGGNSVLEAWHSDSHLLVGAWV